MTKQELSLLLYVESCAVDQYGGLHQKHLNEDDVLLLNAWNKTGYVLSGRIATPFPPSGRTMWAILSEKAWADAARERQARALRMWDKKPWQTTEEKRAS